MKNKLFRIRDFIRLELALTRRQRWFKALIMQRVRDTCNAAYERMSRNVFTESEVDAYIAHLPIIGRHGFYPRKMFVLSTQCLLRMYEYSKEKGFVDKHVSFLGFMKHKLDYDNEKYERNLTLPDGTLVGWDWVKENIVDLVKKVRLH